ncbi:hypothetical protein HHL16_13705 [Pseudoflavitalea sp. G-6-1-2]|uniref:hypothetical protein n=1 Tax=Pseudoflavitalea sp. G-6-1-2 TaxID=2728841 RepID=UPI00146F841C|nr:hypothetical protein [Pseudoflavitalea sp. G-6-1-2]NML21939.1 hypothetical protein [Pseudoflavitalea sp. G-6-1-2]
MKISKNNLKTFKTGSIPLLKRHFNVLTRQGKTMVTIDSADIELLFPITNDKHAALHQTLKGIANASGSMEYLPYFGTPKTFQHQRESYRYTIAK